MSIRPPAPCPRTTSWVFNAIPLDEPGFGSCQTNSAEFPTHGHKAGKAGLYRHPGADLGWKFGICGAARIFIPAISKEGCDAAAASAGGEDDTNTPGKLSKVSWGCAMLSSAQKGVFKMFLFNYDALQRQQSRSKGCFSLPSHLSAIYLPTVRFNYAITVCTKLSVSSSG